MRHFLTLEDFSRDELWQVLKRARELKAFRAQGVMRLDSLSGRIFAMLF